MTATFPLTISGYKPPKLFPFSENHAIKYGLNEAFIISLLKQILEGGRELRCYEKMPTKVSEKEFAQHFPYIDIGKLRIALQHLINHGVLERFHKNTSHDGTPCYSLCMEIEDI